MSPLPVTVLLTPRPVSIADLAPAAEGCGGECVFLGRTRPQRHPEHGMLEALDYEAHESLALAVLERIAREAAVGHGCGLMRIVHATGRVGLGEASVLVQAAAPHRAEAFAACREAIDRLKREAPIWKRECWTAGSTWVAGVPVSAAEPPDRPASSAPSVPGARP
jgi:molybdopterin synthase catalytic subunit